MTLRRRLTFSYAFVLALALSLVAVVASQFAFQFLLRPTAEAVHESAAAARRVVAARPNGTAASLEKDVVRVATRRGVSIIVVATRGMHITGPPEESFVALSDAWFITRLGLRAEIIRFRDGSIVIAPDFRRISPALRRYAQYVIAAIVVAFIAAWLIARWITAQALDPLALVTAELERFGNGDFRPRSLGTSDRSELGRLTTAYNRAARQVSAAFAQRERVETEMRSLLGDAGHALRTPLTVVSGFIDILDSAAIDDARIRQRALRSMRLETTRMRMLVEGLMSLARFEQTEGRTPQHVDVVRTAQLAIERVRVARGGDIALISSGDVVVVADPAEVLEAIVNLVENAVKYGAQTPVAVEIFGDPASVGVRVRDCGPGIPERERPHIFERFFRGERSENTDGSGLGLAIVARAVKRCDGTVTLERADPGDTSFLVRFPRGTNAQAADIVRDAPDAPPKMRAAVETRPANAGEWSTALYCGSGREARRKEP